MKGPYCFAGALMKGTHEEDLRMKHVVWVHGRTPIVGCQVHKMFYGLKFPSLIIDKIVLRSSAIVARAWWGQPSELPNQPKSSMQIGNNLSINQALT
jgi:hypothetical protein